MLKRGSTVRIAISSAWSSVTARRAQRAVECGSEYEGRATRRALRRTRYNTLTCAPGSPTRCRAGESGTADPGASQCDRRAHVLRVGGAPASPYMNTRFTAASTPCRRWISSAPATSPFTSWCGRPPAGGRTDSRPSGRSALLRGARLEQHGRDVDVRQRRARAATRRCPRCASRPRGDARAPRRTQRRARRGTCS